MVTTTPEGAEIRLITDDGRWRIIDAGTPYSVDPGRYMVRVAHDEYEGAERALDLAIGASASLDFVLEPVAPEVPVVAEVPVEPPVDEPTPEVEPAPEVSEEALTSAAPRRERHVAVPVTLAVFSAGALATSVVMYQRESSLASDFQNYPATTLNPTVAEWQAIADDGKQAHTIAVATLGVGAGLGALSIITGIAMNAGSGDQDGNVAVSPTADGLILRW